MGQGAEVLDTNSKSTVSFLGEEIVSAVQLSVGGNFLCCPSCTCDGVPESVDSVCILLLRGYNRKVQAQNPFGSFEKYYNFKSELSTKGTVQIR